jgi:hypothetical protein
MGERPLSFPAHSNIDKHYPPPLESATPMPGYLRFENVTRRFGSFTAVDRVSLWPPSEKLVHVE